MKRENNMSLKVVPSPHTNFIMQVYNESISRSRELLLFKNQCHYKTRTKKKKLNHMKTTKAAGNISKFILNFQKLNPLPNEA